MSEDVHYDPYDVGIDADPYPVFRRLRDEQPLYHNDRYDFFALSRFDDVERCSVDWRTYSSARGMVLEHIKAGFEAPPGTIIAEDPPTHDLHRALVARVFTPRRVSGLEPKVRELCARCLDPLVGADGFDFVQDLGADVPMWTIGMLLGIPEEAQEGIRAMVDATLELQEGSEPDTERWARLTEEMANNAFRKFLDWRVQHPSDDLMTELLQVEFDDHTGTRRRLTTDEVLSYTMLLAAAGNETTTRLIGWAGKVLAEHPEQRAELVEDRALLPGAIEELLRYESPSPIQARLVTRDVEHHGHVVAEGSVMVLLTAAANRDERAFPDADRFDVHRKIDHHLAFGHGVHFCMGAALARLEARVALDEVLSRFPSWELDTDNLVAAHTSTVRGWERLPVTLG